jgi:hypothetical protein
MKLRNLSWQKTTATTDLLQQQFERWGYSYPGFPAASNSKDIVLSCTGYHRDPLRCQVVIPKRLYRLAVKLERAWNHRSFTVLALYHDQTKPELPHFAIVLAPRLQATTLGRAFRLHGNPDGPALVTVQTLLFQSPPCSPPPLPPPPPQSESLLPVGPLLPWPQICLQRWDGHRELVQAMLLDLGIEWVGPSSWAPPTTTIVTPATPTQTVADDGFNRDALLAKYLVLYTGTVWGWASRLWDFLIEFQFILRVLRLESAWQASRQPYQSGIATSLGLVLGSDPHWEGDVQQLLACQRVPAPHLLTQWLCRTFRADVALVTPGLCGTDIDTDTGAVALNPGLEACLRYSLPVQGLHVQPVRWDDSKEQPLLWRTLMCSCTTIHSRTGTRWLTLATSIHLVVFYQLYHMLQRVCRTEQQLLQPTVLGLWGRQYHREWASLYALWGSILDALYCYQR